MVEHTCIHEERFANLEADVAQLQARLDGKRDDIHVINKELLRDRQQQTELIESVTRITVILEQQQKSREANNKQLKELEKKIDKLQEELTDNKEDVIELTSSLNSFRNTMLALIPVITVVVTIVLHFIKI